LCSVGPRPGVRGSRPSPWVGLELLCKAGFPPRTPAPDVLAACEAFVQVYEPTAGTLRNLGAAVRRGRQMRCAQCGRTGATVGCRLEACDASYHVACAAAAGCSFDTAHFVLACPRHAPVFGPRTACRNNGSQHAKQQQHGVHKKKKKALAKMVGIKAGGRGSGPPKHLGDCGGAADARLPFPQGTRRDEALRPKPGAEASRSIRALALAEGGELLCQQSRGCCWAGGAAAVNKGAIEPEHGIALARAWCCRLLSASRGGCNCM
jgi:hypothetical protein